ncbi:zinc finger protein 37 homolog [Rhipicephalus sanguineus]|uniref:zinc finger protein 37 homolog n=1 Tax=Rhipicephalus sanguineus TaxID=34632 RepID=UPI0020C46CCC|nr:zinc finger protein 37 homolog [Rhipicephalus sanguineus]
MEPDCPDSCPVNFKMEPNQEPGGAKRTGPIETSHSGGISDEAVAAVTEWPRNSTVKVESQQPTGRLEKASSNEIDHAEMGTSEDVVSADRGWFTEETDDSDASGEDTTTRCSEVLPVKRGSKRRKQPARFCCKLCPFVTRRKAGMALHLKKHKRAGSLSQAPPSQPPEAEDNITENERSSKDSCTASSEAAAPRKTREKSNSGSERDANLEVLRESESSTCQNREGAKSVESSQCNRTTAEPPAMKEPLMLRCHACSFVTKYQASLFVHIKSHAAKKEPKSKSPITSHAREHTGEKPFKCTECQRAFVDKGNLVAHKRTCCGKTPYKCSFCPCEFNQKSLLRRHVLRSHGHKENGHS